MPRRVYTYSPEMNWDYLNLIASLGAIFMTAGIAVFIWNFFQSKASGRLAGADPWGGGSGMGNGVSASPI